MRNFVCGAAALLAGSTSFATSAPADFNPHVQEIFEVTCIECHGPKKQKGKLRLDTRDDALKRDAIIAPGDADSSELYLRIILPEDDPDRMPNEGAPLTKAQTDAIAEWINQGANWPEDLVLQQRTHDASESFGFPPLPPATDGENEALAKLATAGIHVLPLASNVGWRAANLRPLGLRVTDQELVALGRINTLIHLDLAGTAITDAGLAQLRELKHLSRLHLERTRVTDTGLSSLSNLTELTYLNLYGTAITDDGLDHLHPLLNLKQVYLSGTQTTEEGRKRLRSAIPGLRIITQTPQDVPSPGTSE